MRSLSLSRRRRRGTREPRYTRFSQQDLPGWSGQPGPWQAALLLTAAAAALFALGGASLVASASVIEVSARYDLACAPGGPVADAAAGAAAWAAAGGGAPDNARPPCTLTLPPLPRPVRPGTPLFLYYALSSFHQNHRRYARSRWDAQLRGEVGGGAAASGPALDVACAPRARADPADPASSPTTPCGLVAWSTFNDTFQLSVLAPASSSPADASLAAPLPVAGTGIGVPGDGAARFGNGSVWASPGHNSDPATRGGRAAGRAGAFVVPLSEDEHLHVWMRPAALPSFRKLWGVVRVEGVGGLPAGAAVAIAIDNRFNSYSPGGSKAVVLTTASWLGGANAFTGWALIGTAGAYTVAAVGLAGVGWAGRRTRRAGGGAWEI